MTMAQNSQQIDHFLSKLKLPTGEQLPDPSSLPYKEWEVDLKLWPSLEYPQIFLYLVYNPSEYQEQQQHKKKYRDLDIYKNVIRGHVQQIEYHSISKTSEFCFLKAQVRPRKRKGDASSSYSAWVCLHKQTAEILTVYCTCMARSGIVCNHAGAVLIKIEMAVRTGLTKPAECRSEIPVWDDMTKKENMPVPLSQMDFTKRKRVSAKNSKDSKKSTSKEDNPPSPITAITDNDIKELRNIYPQAVVLTRFVWDSDPSDSESSSESGDDLMDDIDITL